LIARHAGAARAALASLTAAALLGTACGAAPELAANTRAVVPPPVPWFSERAAETGLDAVHFNGMSGAFYFPEMMGPGIALFDYDNDGDLDVYFVQGTMLGAGTTLADARFPPPRAGLGDRLYRNDLDVTADGGRRQRFTDVTPATGLAAGYGMGVATGDVDNDGCTDLYLTRFGQNRLLRNNCDGTFADVTASSGTGHSGWSVSASFVDVDRDGWLDLYVGDYVTYRTEDAAPCFTPSGKPDYCSPNAYRARRGQLFHNQGGGRFANITMRSGIGAAFGPGLGVVATDVNRDGWPDLYVANDGQDNQLWINRGDGTFTNTAGLAGVAVNGSGRPEGSMGTDAGDVDGDGDDDLIVTNLTGEGHALYLNDGTGTFEDAGTRSGLRPASLPFTGFGTALIDVDNDGRLDVLAVNGAVRVLDALAQAGDRFPLRQRPQLFANTGDARFRDASDAAGPAFAEAWVGRGAAFGDVDNDGDTDVVVAANNGPVRLLRNDIGSRAGWIGLRLVGAVAGATARRDMTGAEVTLTCSDGTAIRRRSRTDGSYASASDPRVLIGLGARTAASLRVRWPDGREESWPAPLPGRYTTVVEGTGR
jgi:enediyne biosynthesis protein E4